MIKEKHEIYPPISSNIVLPCGSNMAMSVLSDAWADLNTAKPYSKNPDHPHAFSVFCKLIKTKACARSFSQDFLKNDKAYTNKPTTKNSKQADNLASQRADGHELSQALLWPSSNHKQYQPSTRRQHEILSHSNHHHSIMWAWHGNACAGG